MALAVLWPVLRLRERLLCGSLVVALLAAPFTGLLFGRLAVPLHEDRAPLFGVTALRGQSHTSDRQSRLADLAQRHPDAAVVHFGLGWIAARGHDPVTAEAAYRRALERWPDDDRVLNNLANVIAVQGRLDEALVLYRRAIDRNPDNAAAHFNVSQIYTHRFDYRAASEAASRAAALDFDLVKTRQALATEDGVMPLANLWLDPARLWRMAWTAPDAEPAVPPAWRHRVETRGPGFSVLAGVLVLASLAAGIHGQRTLPLRPCHNCGRVVCRRCAERRREQALCPGCAAAEAQAESPEFGRVLLTRQRFAADRGERLLLTTLAALVPGYGLVAYRRTFRALVLLASAATLAAPRFGVFAPFSFEPVPGAHASQPSAVVELASWILVYAFSFLSYLPLQARARAQAATLATPVRSRPSQATHERARAA
jgi:hypothetical protein